MKLIFSGIAQPIKSTESIWKRALLLEKEFKAEIITVDQSSLHTQLQSLCDTAIGVSGTIFPSSHANT
jgi:hypothetical protein